ncbi:hypothetical protein CEXT_209701 [Caerostris extrusa]|uniref:Uncharacterized protein n=1 Tax=Caerostris extrusa TaxID=172846 RepID=A0AAV4PGG1_CAEEX|nr:hypothetical protein CEXT_209701 [Caerostris extrusa]
MFFVQRLDAAGRSELMGFQCWMHIYGRQIEKPLATQAALWLDSLLDVTSKSFHSNGSEIETLSGAWSTIVIGIYDDLMMIEALLCCWLLVSILWGLLGFSLSLRMVLVIILCRHILPLIFINKRVADFECCRVLLGYFKL